MLGKFFSGTESPQDPPRPATYEEYVPETLRPLGLASERYDYERFREAVARRLGISIELLPISARSHPELYRKLIESGDYGICLRGVYTGDALIVYIDDLPYGQKLKTIYHELEHIVCGHSMPQSRACAIEHRSLRGMVDWITARDSVEGLDGRASYDEELWEPPAGQRIISRPPIHDLDFCNREAEVRADHAIRAGAEGPEKYFSQAWFFRGPGEDG